MLLFRYFFLGKAFGMAFIFFRPDQLIYSIIITVFCALTITVIIVSNYFTKSISYYGIQKHFYLKIKSPEQEMSLWQSLKLSFQGNNILTSLAGALTICISYSFFDNQFCYFKLSFDISDKESGFYSQIIKSSGYLFGMTIAITIL
jgi:hypothetical protein